MAKRPNITREQFLSKAKPVIVKVSMEGYEGEYTLTLSPREFSTDGLGWYAAEKLPLAVDGENLDVQVGLNFGVIGSKLLPKSAPAPKLTPKAK